MDDRAPSGGKLSAAVFESGKEWKELVSEVQKLFLATNPLHVEQFPKVRQLEAEIVRMTINLYNGDNDACGLTTGGGTESLLMAVLAYREWGRRRKISRPNM